MTLDVLTLMLLVIVCSGLLSGALTLVGYRKIPVLMIWAAALALHGLAYTLFMLRSLISDVVSIIVANALVSAVFSFFLLGVARFYRQSLPRSLLWGPPFLVVACFAVNFDDLYNRFVIGSMIYCAQVAVILWLFSRHYRSLPGRGKFIVITGFTLIFLMFLLRLVATAGGYTEVPGILAQSQLQQLSFLTALLTLLMLATGLVLMVQERTESELLLSRTLLARQNEDLVRSQQELEAANIELRRLAITDPLTELYNRRHFSEQLLAQSALARRHELSLAVMMIDIDYFKKFNDRYGHPQGDVCLRRVARALSGELRRGNDVLARIGGEEFAVIVNDTSAVRLEEFASRLRSSVHALHIPHEDSPTGRVTLSVGCALVESMLDVDTEQLMRWADEALYRAKQAGRDRCDISTPALLSAGA